MKIEFFGRGGEAGVPVPVSAPTVLRSVRTLGWPRMTGAVASAACLAVLAGCGGSTSADGDWSGRIEFGGEGGEEASMELSLSLSESEDGSIGGSGVLAVKEDGETKERELEDVSGRVSEDGGLSLTASSGEFLSGVGVELRGALGRGSMDGEATVGADGILPDALAGAELLAGSEGVSGEFALRREGE